MASTRVKLLLLIFILGMPVLIYLFLQGFGENKYDVPVFYDDGLPKPRQGCPDSSNPHTIDQFISQGPCNTWQCSLIEQKLVLYSFTGSNCQDNLSEVARVCNLFMEEEYLTAVTLSLDSLTKKEVMTTLMQQYPIAPHSWLWWSFDPMVNSIIRCGFDLEPTCSLTEQAVLVDRHARIRGYYQLDNQKEFDRLVTEITIILKQGNF